MVLGISAICIAIKRAKFIDNHFCLLNNNKVKKLRDDLMTTLINQGLAEISHSYVVTDGGRVDVKYIPLHRKLLFSLINI